MPKDICQDNRVLRTLSSQRNDIVSGKEISRGVKMTTCPLYDLYYTRVIRNKKTSSHARPLGYVPGGTRHHSNASDDLSDLSASTPTSGRQFRSSNFQRLSPSEILSNLLAANKKPANPHKGARLLQVPLKHTKKDIADRRHEGIRSLLAT